jgi:hypothetical protein
VVREIAEAVKLHVIELLGAPDHAEHQVANLLGRSKEESVLDGSSGQLVEHTRDEPAQGMTHARGRSNARANRMCVITEGGVDGFVRAMDV